MAKIRVVDADNDEIALVVNDNVLSTWNAPHPASPFMSEVSLIQQMLNEVYEKGREDKQKEISKTLQSIFGLKG